ncbi:DEAD/DEAH box helicase [Aeromonas dhakensis]|uniref:hypothetical protein n=1 Tax=Aeromonas dhakensis TaxID=196024 RepID=UPI002B493639|nr:hypothetical protein [Aeromonas dhakensis]
MSLSHGGQCASKTINLKPTEFIGHYKNEIPTGNGLHLIKAGTGCGKTTFMTSVYESNRSSLIIFPTKAIAEQVKIEIIERDNNNPDDQLGLDRVVQLEHFPTHSVATNAPVLFDEIQLFKEHGAFRNIFGNVRDKISELKKTNPVYIVTGTWTDHLFDVFDVDTVTDFKKVFERKVGFIELSAETVQGEINGNNLAIYTRSLADIVIKTAIEFADLPTMFYLESREKLRVISDTLTNAGLSNIVVTSRKDEQPEAVKAWFKSGNIRDAGVDVILCTSVVAEGINVRDGANIICMPDATERLVQRFGRNRIDPITGECAGRYFLIGNPDMVAMPSHFNFENPDVGTLKQVTDGFSSIENDEHRAVANEFKHYQDMCRSARFAQYIWFKKLPEFGYHPDTDLVMEYRREGKDQASKSVRMKTAVETGLKLLLETPIADDVETLIREWVKKDTPVIKKQSVNDAYRFAFVGKTKDGKEFKTVFINRLVADHSVLFETAFKRVCEIERLFSVFGSSRLNAQPLEFMTQLDKEARDWCALYGRSGRDIKLSMDHEINQMGLLADIALQSIDAALKEEKKSAGEHMDMSRDAISFLAHSVFTECLGENMPDKWVAAIASVDGVVRANDSMINLFALLIGAERVRARDGDDQVWVWRYTPDLKWWCEIPSDLKGKYYSVTKALKKHELTLKAVCQVVEMLPTDVLTLTAGEIVSLYKSALNPEPVVEIARVVHVNKPASKVAEIESDILDQVADWGV